MYRLTFRRVFLFAESRGIYLERSAKGYEFWRKGQDHTVGLASTLKEAYEDIFNF